MMDFVAAFAPVVRVPQENGEAHHFTRLPNGVWVRCHTSEEMSELINCDVDEFVRDQGKVDLRAALNRKR